MQTSGCNRFLSILLLVLGLALVAGGCGGGGGGGTSTLPTNPPSSNPPTSLPTLTIDTPDDFTAESGTITDSGMFRISRTGTTTAALTVLVAVEGTADNAPGVDFDEAPIGSSIEIPAGSDSIDIEISAIDDAEIEGLETLVIRLLPDTAAYALGQDTAATVEFIDDDTIVEDISVVEANSRIAGEQGNPLFQIIDVRTPSEFAAGHLEGAINIDYWASDFGERISLLDPAGTYLVHCKSGGRSAPARDQMAQINLRIIWNMEGGINAWVAVGYPVVTD